jgi:phosphoribosylaminoimidazolecarboxamide formyltransferase/IMP cyclohydrolase
MNQKPIVLLSLTNKRGSRAFATALRPYYRLVSTGGTVDYLQKGPKMKEDFEPDVPALVVENVEAITMFPEILDGRVKTLHPALYAGLLAKRDKEAHMAQLTEHKLPEIGMVVCNFYAFEEAVANGLSLLDTMENMDIGGPCMVRAAIKNWSSVVVVTDPSQYGEIIPLLRHSPSLTPKMRFRYATVAAQKVAKYDTAIVDYMVEQDAMMAG